jgi:hypothetical protein
MSKTFINQLATIDFLQFVYDGLSALIKYRLKPINQWFPPSNRLVFSAATPDVHLFIECPLRRDEDSKLDDSWVEG